MIENIDYHFWVCLGVTLFGAIWSAGAIYGVFLNTKEVENDKLKKCLRVVLTTFLICLWLWGCCYKLLYPISLAKYEYNCAISITETGVINNIKRVGKSHVKIVIDNVAYTAVAFGSDESWNRLENQFKKGDCVSFQYGKSSKYIFLISKETQDSEMIHFLLPLPLF